VAGTPVLVVHPDDALRRLLRLNLERGGVPVHEAVSAAQALDVYRGGLRCSAVVLCQGEPVGMTAAEFVAAIRTFDHTVHIFFFTSLVPDVGPDPPRVRVFAKPGELGALIAACRACAT
jgi:CheY-like chemotaxis protein